MNGITLEIYRTDYNSKLNRMFDKKEVFWRCEGGNLEEAPAGVPEIIIETRKLSHGDYLTAYPIEKKTDGNWYMFGGSFVYCSDSRFSSIFRYPVPLHDRVE
jgi:hypothetical protein